MSEPRQVQMPAEPTEVNDLKSSSNYFKRVFFGKFKSKPIRDQGVVAGANGGVSFNTVPTGNFHVVKVSNL